MKATIKYDKGTKYWRASFNNKHEWFITLQAAMYWSMKEAKRWYKESAAYSMLRAVVQDRMTVREQDFIIHLPAKCKGITKAQYGYLKGIHERQQREW